MINKKTGEIRGSEKKTLKNLVNTPFKKVLLMIQVLSYVLIVFSPILGGAIGAIMKFNAARSGGFILGIFIAGEILFYTSLLFLGKEIIYLTREKLKLLFGRYHASKKREDV